MEPNCVICHKSPRKVHFRCVQCALDIAAEHGDIALVYGLAQEHGKSLDTVQKILRAANASRKMAA